MKPEFMLINWSKGTVVGCGTATECREQMVKCSRGTAGPNDTYLLTEVKVLSEMKRVES